MYVTRRLSRLSPVISVFSDLVRTPSVRTFRSDVSRRQPKGGGDRGEKKSKREKEGERRSERGRHTKRGGGQNETEREPPNERAGGEGRNVSERERGDSRAIGCSTQSSSVCQPVIYGRSS